MVVYYVEVNAICIIFLLLLGIQIKNTDTSSSEQRTLILMIISTVLFCLADMTAGVFRGRLFPGAAVIIEASNLLYFELLVIISYFWAVYVYMRLMPNSRYSIKTQILVGLPAILFTLIAISNPYTHILFYVTSENLYQRNSGIYLHWIVVWGYFLVPSIKAMITYANEKSQIKRQEIKPLMYFIAAPFAASIIQMLFYGVTTTQVGITVSIVLICVKAQEKQILTDALTGINNRRAIDYFMENKMAHNNEDVIYTLIMIDIDRFKQINDKYGHVTGDLVLKKFAQSLKSACKAVSNHMTISRFGGDEFVVLGTNCTEEDVSLLIEMFYKKLQTESEDNELPCKVTASVGFAQGKCTQPSEYKQLISKADAAMYKIKADRDKKA